MKQGIFRHRLHRNQALRNAVASTPQDHWLYNELVDGFHIDRVVRDYNYSMDIRHIHEEYEIYYLLEGERYYFINQQTYLVTPNAGLH